MKRHYGQTKAQRQADWMARFSDAVITLEPRHAGKIDWNSAQHFYFSGLDAAEAAQKYVNNRKD